MWWLIRWPFRWPIFVGHKRATKNAVLQSISTHREDFLTIKSFVMYVQQTCSLFFFPKRNKAGRAGLVPIYIEFLKQHAPSKCNASSRLKILNVCCRVKQKRIVLITIQNVIRNLFIVNILIFSAGMCNSLN